MSDAIQPRPPADAPSSVRSVAVAIAAGVVGGHCGLYYRRDDDSVFLLHLAFHLILAHDPADAEDAKTVGWIEPKIPAEKLDVLAELCSFVADHYADGRVPYGFRFERSEVREDGVFVFGEDEQGLTCATFVLALCERAQIVLIARSTWSGADQARKDEDREAQKKLLAVLRGSSKAHWRAHAAALEAEVGAPRFRAEEVAAASGAHRHPLDYEQARMAGADLLVAASTSAWWLRSSQ